MPKKSHAFRNLPLFLSGLSFLFFVVGFAFVFLLQQPLQLPQVLQNKAATSNGQVLVSTGFQDTTSTNSNAYFSFLVNTQSVQIDEVQLVFDVITNTSNALVVNSLNGSGLQITYSQVQSTPYGYHVSLIASPPSNTQPFSSTTPIAFVQLVLGVRSPGTIQFNFDEQQSIANVHGTNPPQNQLNLLNSVTYSTVGPWSSNVQPTTSPDLGLRRQCNEYCADTRECDPAGGYTCFYNRCRRPDNPDSPTCAPTTQTVSQVMAQSCNSVCNGNQDCAVNLRCYYGRCRLATNPQSQTCAVGSATQQSTIVVVQHTKGEVIPLPEDLTASSSATLSALPTPFLLYATPSATPITAFENPRSGNLLQDFLSSLQDHGVSLPSLPIMAIGAGALLLILAIIIFVMSSLGHKNITTPQTIPTKPQTPMPAPSTQPRPLASTPALTPQEKTIEARLHELQEQELLSKPPAAPATPPQMPNTMMEKIREKGLTNQIPNPSQASQS